MFALITSNGIIDVYTRILGTIKLNKRQQSMCNTFGRYQYQFILAAQMRHAF